MADGGAGFIRRFTSEPSDAELTAIEGVVIIDREAPAAITGASTGTVLVVGEFEDGPFNTPVEVLGATDLVTQFGGFGYTYDGVVASNPSARARKADAAIKPEYWNGNGYIALVNKRFSRLILCRVDTSVGEVQLTRLASLSGSNAFSYALTSGQTVVLNLGASNLTATFTGTPATTSSSAGTYPTTFTGGESMTYIIDGKSYTTYFLSGDQTQTQAIARLNATVGYSAFAIAGGGVTSLTGRIGGTSGNVQIVAVSGVSVTTALGFAAGASVPGTGNVANIAQVTVAEANTIIGAATTAAVVVDRNASGQIRLTNVGTPGTGTLVVDASSTADAFGFAEGVTVSAASGSDGVIPAGTRVRTGGGTEWVTMQTIAVTAGNAGPYAARIRPANDDGTTSSASVGTINVLPAPIPLGAFAVINALPVSAALSESAIDAAYATAIDKTINVRSVAQQTNVIVSARQSNAIRTRLKQNALDASAQGCFGREAVIRPPLGTLRAVARSSTAQPGVGTYRSERVIYAYPGARTFVPQIAVRGTAGGTGFTSDGNIDVGYDTWIASTLSQLPPEEDPGQQTDTQAAIIDLEAGNPDVQDLRLEDYAAFKAAGIAALRINGGNAFIQSGVTSVDPVSHPNQVNINRRRMADYIEDSLAPPLNALTKKLASTVRQTQVIGIIDGFLSGLKSKDNPANARIADYSIDGKSGNTPAGLAKGIFRVLVKVKTFPAFLTFVLDVTVGETVTIDVQPLATAA